MTTTGNTKAGVFTMRYVPSCSSFMKFPGTFNSVCVLCNCICYRVYNCHPQVCHSIIFFSQLACSQKQSNLAYCTVTSLCPCVSLVLGSFLFLLVVFRVRVVLLRVCLFANVCAHLKRCQIYMRVFVMYVLALYGQVVFSF